jgi:hypothetical protein
MIVGSDFISLSFKLHVHAPHVLFAVLSLLLISGRMPETGPRQGIRQLLRHQWNRPQLQDSISLSAAPVSWRSAMSRTDLGELDRYDERKDNESQQYVHER